MTGPAAPAAGAAPSILMVCTGNVCRSPAAEHLLRSALGPGRAVVRSAGTRALVGHPVDAPMRRLLVEAGCQPEGFTARRLTAADIAGADLVLTAERGHRTAVVELCPAALRRTFTLLEFADMASLAVAAAGDDLPGPGVAQRLPWLLEQIPAARARRVLPAADDVPDPFGQDDECFAEVLAQIEAAVDALRSAFLDRAGERAA